MLLTGCCLLLVGRLRNLTNERTSKFEQEKMYLRSIKTIQERSKGVIRVKLYIKEEGANNFLFKRVIKGNSVYLLKEKC